MAFRHQLGKPHRFVAVVRLSAAPYGAGVLVLVLVGNHAVHQTYVDPLAQEAGAVVGFLGIAGALPIVLSVRVASVFDPVGRAFVLAVGHRHLPVESPI